MQSFYIKILIFVIFQGSISPLKSYIDVLYNSFEFLLNFNNLLQLITDLNTNDIIRLLSAYILVIVFELKLQKKGIELQQILSFPKIYNLFVII